MTPREPRHAMAAHGTRATWCLPLTHEIDRLLAAGTPPTLGNLVRSLETIAIDRALAFTGGNRSRAARLLGMGRNTIARKIDELELNNRVMDQNKDARS
jgi:two-component system nitrogen regulation response regulator GlnG